VHVVPRLPGTQLLGILLLPERGVVDECLKNFLVSSPCVCITPLVRRKKLWSEVVSSQRRSSTRTPS